MNIYLFTIENDIIYSYMRLSIVQRYMNHGYMYVYDAIDSGIN